MQARVATQFASVNTACECCFCCFCYCCCCPRRTPGLQGAFYILSYPLVEFLNQGSSKLLTFDNEVTYTFTRRVRWTVCMAYPVVEKPTQAASNLRRRSPAPPNVLGNLRVNFGSSVVALCRYRFVLIVVFRTRIHVCTHSRPHAHMHAGRDDRAVAARRGQGDISPQRPPGREAVAVLLQPGGLQPG